MKYKKEVTLVAGILLVIASILFIINGFTTENEVLTTLAIFIGGLLFIAARAMIVYFILTILGKNEIEMGAETFYMPIIGDIMALSFLCITLFVNSSNYLYKDIKEQI